MSAEEESRGGLEGGIPGAVVLRATRLRGPRGYRRISTRTSKPADAQATSSRLVRISVARLERSKLFEFLQALKDQDCCSITKLRQVRFLACSFRLSSRGSERQSGAASTVDFSSQTYGLILLMVRTTTTTRPKRPSGSPPQWHFATRFTMLGLFLTRQMTTTDPRCGSHDTRGRRRPSQPLPFLNLTTEWTPT